MEKSYPSDAELGAYRKAHTDRQFYDIQDLCWRENGLIIQYMDGEVSIYAERVDIPASLKVFPFRIDFIYYYHSSTASNIEIQEILRRDMLYEGDGADLVRVARYLRTICPFFYVSYRYDDSKEQVLYLNEDGDQLNLMITGYPSRVTQVPPRVLDAVYDIHVNVATRRMHVYRNGFLRRGQRELPETYGRVTEDIEAASSEARKWVYMHKLPTKHFDRDLIRLLSEYLK